MAKLTDRQKNNIIAKWNTGSYSKLQLAKAYKVSDVMIGKIVGKEKPIHSHIVEAGVMLESVKKFGKSSSEVKAIDNAIKYELNSIKYKEKNIENVHKNANELMNIIMEKARTGIAQKVVTVGRGQGYSNSEVVEYDYQPEHYEKAINIVEKTAKILGTIETTPSVQIANQNVQEKEINITID